MRPRRRFLVFILLAIFLISVLSVSAQDVTPVRYGQTIEGRIADTSQGVVYSFEGRQGDVVVLAVTSSAGVDTVVRLADPQGTILMEVDDPTTGTIDPTLEFTLPTDGTYLVGVAGYSVGPFTLSVSLKNAPAPAAAEGEMAGIPVAYGDQAQGRLETKDSVALYQFQGRRGETVVIEVLSDAVDTLVRLGSPLGEVLVENDDRHQNNLNPLLEYTLTADGTYIIAVLGYDAGPFTLVLSSPNAQAAAVPAQAQGNVLQYGAEVAGELAGKDDSLLYEFQGRRGEQVIIETSSAEVDTLLRLADSQGTVLVENDDQSQTNLNARIEYTLPADGLYIVAVLGYGRGAFSLTIESPNAQAGPPPSQAQSGGALQYGASVTGTTIDIDNAVVYEFQGTAGDVVQIASTSDAVDTYVVLADSNLETLAENDDIAQDNLNAALEFTLPATGTYVIGVFGYEAGPFTLTLASAGQGAPVVVEDTAPAGQVFTGQITNDAYFVEFPLTVERPGSTITIDVRATGGDLDAYVGLLLGKNVVAENDDRVQGDPNPLLVYENAQPGDYTIVVTRYDLENGQTTGAFEMNVSLGSAPASLAGTTPTTVVAADIDPTQRGYPAIQPRPMAEWTVLTYLGGDNNIEDASLNDLNEFELMGGSTNNVRVVALLDRSPEFGASNGNWTGARLFEMGADRSRDQNSVYPPTVDTQPLADLGEIDTSYGRNLADFLIWGMRQYPARRYAISLNDHGGAWTGIITDDTTGHGEIMTIPEMQEAFQMALQATGVSKFDLLVNDACLMSSVEMYTAMSPFFNFSISSPEIQNTPGFDMTLFTQALNQQPNIDVGQLGQLVADKYMSDMRQLFGDQDAAPLGAMVVDLRKFDAVTAAVDKFADVVNSNPSAFASSLGRARSNAYGYSFFMPPDQFGPPTNIDIGSLMRQIQAVSSDKQLTSAAQDVLTALDGALLYGTAGDHLARSTSYYNIYFPPSLEWSSGEYSEQNPIPSWTNMLVNYFQAVNPGRIRAIPLAAPSGEPIAAPVTLDLNPAIDPQVTITNIFPVDTASLAFPVILSMEVTGRNIDFGDFTVDYVLDDGTTVRLDKSRIVTQVVEDNVAEWINLWKPGVDDSDFTWSATASEVTDGRVSSYELVETRDSVSSLAGRYRFPGSETWLEVTVIFGEGGGTANVVTGGNALARLTPEVGGEFQAYRSVVTPDGQVASMPGTLFTWPEGGLSYRTVPAPSGQYNLGFKVEAFGGLTGFGSATVAVDNDTVDPTLRGYVDDDWGFNFQRPEEWFDVTYFPDGDFLQTNDVDNTEFIFVYPIYDAQPDLQSIADAMLAKFEMTADGGFTPSSVGGEEALEFAFTYSNDNGTFSSRAFAVYIDYLSLGLVFSVETTDAANTDARYQLLQNTLTFFDASAVQGADTGLWESDSYTENDSYPVSGGWLPGVENGLWWTYTPGDVGPGAAQTFASITVLNEPSEDAKATLETLVQQELAILSGYTEIGRDTYYAENNTWEAVGYTRDGLTGRMYVTLGPDGSPYVFWFEAPSAEFEATFKAVFTVMLDGLKIDAAE